MPVTFSPCKIIAACLFASSLFFPSFANAEQPQEELAPGFNGCMKRAKSVGKEYSYERYQAYAKCYSDAGDYWKNIFETECKKETEGGDYYSGDFDGDGTLYKGRYEVQMIRLAWEQYLDALGNYLCHEAAEFDAGYQSVRANEYKKIVQTLREYGIFKKPEKTAQEGQPNRFSN